MNIGEIKTIIQAYTLSDFTTIEITLELVAQEIIPYAYNSHIRKKIQESKFGVYVWMNSNNNEVLYIGMAGKVDKNGKFGKHSLRERLIASRGKDKNKKDIPTRKYIHKFMSDENLDSINFYVFYTKENIPPSYVEALLLFSHLKNENNKLPILNNSF